MPHFSKAFLASMPPFDPQAQTDANDFDAAAAMFEGFQRSANGGLSGLLACVRSIHRTGTVPKGVIILNPNPTSEV